MMILKNGSHFIEALRMQRLTSASLYSTKDKHYKKLMEDDYKNITASIEDYIKNMNAKGERDDV